MYKIHLIHIGKTGKDVLKCDKYNYLADMQCLEVHDISSGSSKDYLIPMTNIAAIEKAE